VYGKAAFPGLSIQLGSLQNITNPRDNSDFNRRISKGE